MVDIYNQFRDFKAFEVILLDGKEKFQKIFCTVKSIENNRIILNANNNVNKNIFAEVGDELKLYIYTENGIYSATSKILLATPGVISTEYVIAYPVNSKHSQRREYFRAEIPVDFSMNISLTENNNENIVVEAKARNICGMGMSYISSTPFPEHNTIELTFFFKEKIINTFANLVYSKQIVIGNRPKFVHAFMFTSISQKHTDFIVKKCFLHQLDLRKKQNI